MAQDYFKGSILNENIVTTTESEVIEVRSAKTVVISGTTTINTPSAITTLPPAIDTTANTITKTSHGLMTGNKLQVAASSTLPAPLSATDYYAIVVDANTIKLAASYANALVPTPINLTTVGVGQAEFTPETFAAKAFTSNSVTIGTENIAISSHGYITGTKVQLTLTGTSLPTPLVAATDYYAIVVDANNIKLAASVADAFVPTPINLTDIGTCLNTATAQVFANKTFTDANVDTGTEKVTIAGHGYVTGVKCRVSNPGALPTGLVAATDYWIIVTSATEIQFAASLSDALAGTAIDLTAAGTGTTTIDVVSYAYGAKTFLNTDVSVADNEITSAAHGFFTGLQISALTTNGILPSGLALATPYYVVSTGANTFKLAASYADAINAVPVVIDITAQGGCSVAVAPHSYSVDSFLSTDVSAANDTITLTGHDYVTGLKIAIATAATLPDPLLAVTDYFSIKVDDNTFKLASSLVLALAGTAIDLTDQGEGLLTLTPTALAGATAKLQYAIETDVDNLVWADVPAAGVTNPSQSITGAQLVYWEKIDPPWSYLRVQCTATAGQFNPALSVLVKK